MKKQYVFVKSTIAGLVSMVLMAGIAVAETAEMSKPKGAMGTGNTQDGQPKTNQFWWQRRRIPKATNIGGQIN